MKIVGEPLAVVLAVCGLLFARSIISTNTHRLPCDRFDRRLENYDLWVFDWPGNSNNPISRGKSGETDRRRGARDRIA
jgi:hypothetical protein